LIIFKYFSCLMIIFRTLIEIDSNWALFVFFKWRSKMKIIDHSWFFYSRRSWISLICSIFFFVVRKRSYSFDWTFTFKFLFDVRSRLDWPQNWISDMSNSSIRFNFRIEQNFLFDESSRVLDIVRRSNSIREIVRNLRLDKIR
jgi:hypothetical protein